MKLKQVYDELLEIARNIGITIRREKGISKGGYCVVNQRELIVLNRMAPLEMRASVMAQSLADRSVEGMFIKPVVREFIERENNSTDRENEFKLEVEY